MAQKVNNKQEEELNLQQQINPTVAVPEVEDELTDSRPIVDSSTTGNSVHEGSNNMAETQEPMVAPASKPDTNPAHYRSARDRQLGVSDNKPMHGYDAFMAQRKQKGSALTWDEFEAVDPKSAERMRLQNPFASKESILSKYETAYNMEAEASKKSHNLGASTLSSRDENGNLIDDRPIGRFENGRSYSKKDMVNLQQMLAKGSIDEARNALAIITGYDELTETDAKEPFVEGNNIADMFYNMQSDLMAKAEALDAAMKEAEANPNDEKKQAAYEAAKQAYDKDAKRFSAVTEALKNAGVTASEDGTLIMPEEITGESLLRPKANALNDEEMKLRQQQNALRKRQIGVGLADLAAGVGDIIKGSTGARVDPRDWSQHYKTLDERGQQLYNTYLARLEAERQRQAAAAEKAADRDLSIRMQQLKGEQDKAKAKDKFGYDTALQKQKDDAAMERVLAQNKNRYNIALLANGSKEKNSDYSIIFNGRNYVLPKDQAFGVNNKINGIIKKVAGKLVSTGKDGKEYSGTDMINLIEQAYGSTASAEGKVNIVNGTFLEMFKGAMNDSDDPDVKKAFEDITELLKTYEKNSVKVDTRETLTL